jgi:hypothetical protein
LHATIKKRKAKVSKRPTAKKAKAGLSRAMPSKAVPLLPKLGLAKKIGFLKIARPKAKPRPSCTSEIELALAKPIGVSKKFCLLDAAGPSHGPHMTGVVRTHAAQVPAFDNLGDDSLLDVRRTPLLVWMIERLASLPPSVSGEFLCFTRAFITAGTDSCFTGVVQPPPLLDLTLKDLDESLESCLRRISFLCLCIFMLLYSL